MMYDASRYDAKVINPGMLKFRGEGEDREQWYSICSMHRDPETGCRLCETGHWVNMVGKNMETMEERNVRLQTIFPGLRPSAPKVEDISIKEVRQPSPARLAKKGAPSGWRGWLRRILRRASGPQHEDPSR